MNSKNIVYSVNGVAVKWWRRMAASKTFWVVSAFILAAADRWNQGEISSADFFQMVQIGVIGILIRAAMAKSELAANAANPEILAVAATEKRTTIPAEVTGVFTCMIAAGALLALTGCAALRGSMVGC